MKFLERGIFIIISIALIRFILEKNQFSTFQAEDKDTHWVSIIELY